MSKEKLVEVWRWTFHRHLSWLDFMIVCVGWRFWAIGIRLWNTVYEIKSSGFDKDSEDMERTDEALNEVATEFIDDMEFYRRKDGKG